MITTAVILLWVFALAFLKTKAKWLAWVQGLGAGLAVAPWGLALWSPILDQQWEHWGWPTSPTPVAHATALAVVVGIWGVLWDRSHSLRWVGGFLAVVWPKAAIAAVVGAAFGWGTSTESATRSARTVALAVLFGFGGLLTLYPEVTAHRGLPLGLFFSCLVILRHHERELEVLLDLRSR